MAADAEWALGYARQAEADFKAWEAVQGASVVSECHRLLVFTRHLAAEIELLNPALDRGGRRPNNCEYPWENGKRILHSPLDWKFTPSHLLKQRHGLTFLKLVHAAITELLE